jgi:hypothetical protein
VATDLHRTAWQVAARIWTTVDESSLPVSAGLLASRLKQEQSSSHAGGKVSSRSA